MMEILAGFTLGLFGGLHCVGMCGPIAVSLPYSTESRASMIWDRMTYHLGRTLTYSLLGLLIGLFGHQLHLLGIQHYVSIITGVLLLIVFFIPRLWQRVEKNIHETWMMKSVKSMLSRLINGKSKLLIGIINGFIPCGFVYIALMAALNLNHLEESVLFMSFFGLGTIPLLFASSFLSQTLKKQNLFIFYFRKYATIVLAVLFILRGLSLGIPFLSPEIELGTQDTVSSTCCTE